MTLWTVKKRSVTSRVLLAVALLLAPSATASAETFGDTDNGAKLALEQCAECHLMPGGPEPTNRLKGPNFVDISALPSTTRMSLTVWFRTPHPNMPNLIIEEEDANDLIAYLLSLK